MIFAFGEYQLDGRQYRLRRAGEVIRLQPKVFSVLQYLVQHRERVVSKQELLDEIWPDETLTESVLARTIAVARKALNQKRGEREPIETDYGRGYRFTSEVRLVEERPSSILPPSSSVQPAPSDLLEGEPFVGRADLMVHLRGAMAGVDEGKGALCLLIGEAGIGKTRAAETLADEARARGLSVWSGRCFDGEGSPPFWLWIQILRACAREESPSAVTSYVGTDHDELLTLVPELVEATGLPVPTSTKNSSDDPLDRGLDQRFHLLDSMTRFLRRTAVSRSRVLLLDDLHWADPASLDMLSFLARELSGARLFIVGTMREHEPGNAPVRARLDRLTSESGAECIRMSGLTESDVDDYIKSLTGQIPPGGLSAAVHSRTEGNPFFMRESVQLLTDDSGRLNADDSGVWNVQLPDLARDVIRKRLSAVDVELHAVLEVAAVIGREFEFTILEEVSGLGNRALLDALGESFALSLVREVPAAVAQYSFSHVLIQDTLYDDMPTRRRVGLHQKVAECLAKRYGDHDRSRLSEIAFHFGRALPNGVAEQALHYAHEAGHVARDVYAFDEAVGHYEMALKALDFVKDPDLLVRYGLLTDKGAALGQGGRPDAAVRTFEQARRIAVELDNPMLLAWSVLALSLITRMNYRPAPGHEQMLKDALRRIGEDQADLRARLLVELASLFSRDGRRQEVRAAVQEIVALSEQSPGLDSSFRCLQARYLALQEPADVQQAIEVMDELLELSVSGGRYMPWMEFYAHYQRYQRRVDVADMAGAAEDLIASERLCESHRMRLGEWFCAVAGVAKALAEGRYEGTREKIEQGYLIGTRLRSPAANLMRGIHYAELLVAQGGQAVLRRERDVIDFTEADWAGPYLTTGHARFLAEVGELDDARELVASTFPDGFHTLPRAAGYLGALASAAVTCVALADHERAQGLYPLMEGYSDMMAADLSMIYRGVIAHYQGILARMLGRPVEAEAHLMHAVRRHDELGLRPMAVQSRLELARTLLESGGAGARERARCLVDEGCDAARVMGMRAVIGELQALDM